MYYGSSGDIRLQLGSPSETEVAGTKINLGNQKATSVVNGYLETQWPDDIPWSASGDVPDLIKEVTTDLATYYTKRDLHPGPMPLSDDVKEEYWNKPIGFLERIITGDLKLPELTSKTYNALQANREDNRSIFDIDPIEEASPPSDLIDEVGDSRD